jgi:Cellulose binding domain/Bacterial Ig domain
MRMSQTSQLHSCRSRASSMITCIVCLFCVALTSVPFVIGETVMAAGAVPNTTPTPIPTSITITSPANGSLYTLPTQIPITATVSHIMSGATITQVGFYSNGTLIGTAKTAPYSFNWVSQQAGQYSLTAVAHDSVGHTITSATVSIVVEFPSPPPPLTVTLTSPANNAVYSSKAQIPITASVSDFDPMVTVSKIEFYSGTTLIGTVTAAPYSITWVAGPSGTGTDTLTAKAYDNYGQVITSAPINIFIAVQDPPPPPFVTVTATAAPGSSFTQPANIILAASVSNPYGSVGKVSFYNGSALLGTTTVTPYNIAWNNVPEGIYTITATATDTVWGLTGTSAPLTVTVLFGSEPTPTPPPTVTPTPSPTPTPSCIVRYRDLSTWPGGFTANIIIQNVGTTTINGWTLAFTFPGDQQITNLWNGVVTQKGENVTVINASWNSTIASGSEVNVGFNASWTSNNTSPTTFTLNGQVCQTGMYP